MSTSNNTADRITATSIIILTVTLFCGAIFASATPAEAPTQNISSHSPTVLIFESKTSGGSLSFP